MRQALYTIPSHIPFLDALVGGIRDETGDDPLTLSRVLVLLPTRRAVRGLREAFLRASNGRALLLPQMRPVGDLDGDELALAPSDGASEAAGVPGASDIPPAIPELRRRLLLTRLVLEWGARRGTSPLLPGQAAMLARELARFLDEVQSEGRDFADLAGLAPEEYAEHWQLVLRFLDVLTAHWPAILAAEGCLDPAARRNAVLAAQADAWRRERPERRIIAAGLTGGLPAIDDLLASVAALPRGAIVLPGLEPDVDPAIWAEIGDDPTHPHHVMAQLLARLEAAPADVQLWQAPGLMGEPSERVRLVAETLRPAASTHRWRGIGGIGPEAIRNLHRLDCPSPQEEAGAIALLLRQRLETPGATAALVTPDRDLARRVATELRRWHIEIDDSAGLPLNRTPPGTFLRLVLDLADTALAPVPLLAALKHPLAGCGRAPEELRTLARRLETEVLRGPRPAPGLAGLADALGPHDSKSGKPELRQLVDDLAAALKPLLDAVGAEGVEIGTLVRAHLAAAEALAATATESGAERLWREEAGEVAARFAGELIEAAADFPALRGADYPALFEALLAGPVVRPSYGRHPRLAIWGLLEARLQQADLVVLGGLNEGTWPGEAASDPWLSRPMRRAFGLPPPERAIGTAAHDFAQALGAPEVVMTRALRVEGAPTVPSRWLLRLETVLRAGGLDKLLQPPLDVLAWQALLDRAERRIDLPPPAPRPPLSVRPRRLSVTEIETWMRDPYGIYAKHILKLRALDPLDADPGAAERGILIHEALDRFVREHPGVLPQDAEAKLLAIGRAVFGTALTRPSVWAFWWPRFARIARWFVALEAERRGDLAESRGEIKGERRFAGPGGTFLLSCKADRIDRRRAGGLVIIDYKTGIVPKRGDVDLGFSPQLPLEAAIAASGGFAGLAPDKVAALAYWRLIGGEVAGEVRPIAEDEATVETMIAEATAGLEALIASFDDPRTPYRAWPRPSHAPRFSDYAHLARVKEWSLAAEGE
ncbi:MAG: double-strand break repair protein AddB [Alphaproteobacteria bacterium]|nr:double-strand break repair protein AddB [Alphaproteobacteria bacterium]